LRLHEWLLHLKRSPIFCLLDDINILVQHLISHIFLWTKVQFEPKLITIEFVFLHCLYDKCTCIVLYYSQMILRCDILKYLLPIKILLFLIALIALFSHIYLLNIMEIMYESKPLVS